MTRRWLLALAAGLVVAGPLGAEADVEKAAPEDPAHQELRQLKDQMLDAFHKRDIDGLLKFLHPDAVVIWQNGEVSRKHEGVRDYYQRMLLSPNSVVESSNIGRIDVAELAILYGKDRNTAVAWGTMEDSYHLRDGMDFNLHSRWSVTLVKEGGKWVILSAHLSTNAFENEVMLQAVKRTAFLVGGAGLAVGVVVAFVICYFAWRRRRAV